ASTSASCAISSASPRSRTMRARHAMSLADSILLTASMIRFVSPTVTRDDHKRWTANEWAVLLLLPLPALELLPQLRLLLLQLRSEGFSEVGRVEDGTDLDL